MQQTRNDAARNAWIKLALGLGFIGIGCFVVYLVVQMVGIFGEGMGVDLASRQIYKLAHVAVHIFGTASAIAITLFLMQRNRVLAALALFAVFGCGGYGIVNMIGFTTTNRLSVAESRSAATSAEWKMYDNARADLQRQIKWLEGQAVEADTPREKQRMIREIDAKRKELSAIQPPKPNAASVLADPQATWFSRMTGWAAENWQLALPVPVAFLLFAAEVLSFVFATHLIATAIETLLTMGRAHAPNREGGSGGGGPRLAYKAGDATNIPSKSAMHAEYAGTPTAMQTMQRGVPSVSLADAKEQPKSDALHEYLHEYAQGSGPRRLQTDIARDFGVSQPTVSRQLRRAQERAARKAERKQKNMQIKGAYPGFGGSLHAPAQI